MDGSSGALLFLFVISILSTAFFNLTLAALSTLGTIGLRQLASADKSSALLERAAVTFYDQKNTALIGSGAFFAVAMAVVSRLDVSFFIEIPTLLLFALSGLLFIVFAGIIPTAVGSHAAGRLVVPCMRLMKPFYYLLYPVTKLFGVFAAAAIKLFMTDPSSRRTITMDDLAYLIDVSEEHGVIEEEKQEMLSSIIEISNSYVKSVMTPRTDMVSVPNDITKAELLETIRRSEYSRIPVYNDTLDHIEGIIYVKDIIKFTDPDWDIESVISRLHPVLFVPETKRVDDMLKELQKEHQQMAMVVDEYGGVAGLVTMEDLLEEIVGEIWDEYDDEEDTKDEIIKIAENTYRVDARTNIDDLFDFFDIEHTEDAEYDTVGGLIYDIAGAIPSVGDSYRWNGFEVTVESMDSNKLMFIDFVRRESAPEREEDGVAS